MGVETRRAPWMRIDTETVLQPHEFWDEIAKYEKKNSALQELSQTDDLAYLAVTDRLKILEMKCDRLCRQIRDDINDKYTNLQFKDDDYIRLFRDMKRIGHYDWLCHMLDLAALQKFEKKTN